MGKMVGIDLGTTNSVVAIFDGPSPRVLYSRENRSLTASVVSPKRRGEGELLVGDPALDNWPWAPKDTVASIKRLMGRGVADPEVQRVKREVLYDIVAPADGTQDSVRVVIAGKQYSPIEVSAKIIAKLKEDAERRLGGAVTHAVITVPAYFSQLQRDATRRAGLMAGLTVMKILEEPTAAALAYGVAESKRDKQRAEAGGPSSLGDAAHTEDEAEVVLVYDLGGGTFDVSVLLWAGRTFAPLNLEGDMWLGGDNFDQLIVNHAVDQVKKEHGLDPTTNSRFMATLMGAARKAKEALSSDRTADLDVSSLLHDADGNLIDVYIEIQREQFERMIRPLVERSMHLTDKAVVEAGYYREVNGQRVPDYDQINRVLMAGNSTMVPLVEQELEKRVGRGKLVRGDHPKHAVAEGAALLAARLSVVVCSAPSPADPARECGEVNQLDATKCRNCGAPLRADATLSSEGPPSVVLGEGIAPFHYGAQSANDKFTVYVEKNDTYPTAAPRTESFYTQRPNQRIIAVAVYGGDNRERASANQKQGEAFAILPPGLPNETEIRIKLWLDGDGVFDLDAHIEDGTHLEPWILRGEVDTKAVRAMEEAERALAGKANAMSAVEAAEIENARNKAFELLRRGQFEAALKQAEGVTAMAADVGAGSQDDVLAKAEGLVGFTEFVVQQYPRLLGPERVYELNTLREEVRSRVEQARRAGTGDARSKARGALEEKVTALDTATDDLPDMVRLFMGIRSAIVSRIRPGDPALGATFLRELEGVEEAVDRTERGAEQKLADLLTRLDKAMEGATGPGVERCPNNHENPPGTRICPVCGADYWGVKGSRSMSTGKVLSR